MVVLWYAWSCPYAHRLLVISDDLVIKHGTIDCRYRQIMPSDLQHVVIMYADIDAQYLNMI